MTTTRPLPLTDLPPEQSTRYVERLKQVFASGRDGSTEVVIGGRNIEFRLVAEHDAQAGLVRHDQSSG